MRSSDRRFTKTEVVIIRAMIKLLNSSQTRKISVASLCDVADINKSTLYLHYGSLDQIVAAIEDEVISDITSIIYSRGGYEFERDFFNAILTYIKYAHKKIVAAINGGRTRFGDKLQKALIPFMDSPLLEVRGKASLAQRAFYESQLRQILYIFKIYCLNTSKFNVEDLWVNISSIYKSINPSAS